MIFFLSPPQLATNPTEAWAGYVDMVTGAGGGSGWGARPADLLGEPGHVGVGPAECLCPG